jgi:hypothetical protein
MMEFQIKTFDEWSRLGFKILKGSKSIGKNKDGLCLFSEKQVSKWARAGYDVYKSPDYRTQYEKEWDRIEEKNRANRATEEAEWAMSKGYINYGGTYIDPNDPLSDLVDSYNSDEI